MGVQEAFRAVYAAKNRDEAERRLDRFIEAAQRSGLQPFETLVKGLKPWRAEILAYLR